MTQSFIHALISDILRTNGEDALGLLEFKNCIGIVQGIISTVVQYSLDTLMDEEAIAADLKRDEEEKQQSFRFMKAAQEAAGRGKAKGAFENALEKIIPPKKC